RASPWRYTPASSSRCWAPTAPARPRRSPRSAASRAPTPDRSRSWGTTMRATLRVVGRDVVRDFRQARRAVGIVPQEIVFDPFFTVRETLEIQSGYFGLRRNAQWIDELLQRLALTSKANANMRALSGGMKRRVMVAQALV